MANSYHVGDAVRVSTSTEFTNASSVAFDPDVVRGKFKDPSGNVTTYVYGTDTELVKDATGEYHFDINVDESGTWYYRIEGEQTNGDYRGADEGTFEAEDSEFS